MNEEENKRREELEDERTKSELERNSKKSNKSKFKMMASRLTTFMTIILPILKIVTVIIIIATLIGCLTYIFKLKGHNSIADVASTFLMQEYVTVDKTENDEYYFKIDKKVIDDYLEKLNEAYHNGYYFNTNPEIDEEIPEFVYNPEEADVTEENVANWFKTKDYNPYIIKMIRAEIASSYPILSGYEGEEKTEDKAGNKKDKNGNYVAQGVVQVQRTKMDTAGNEQAPVTLKYLPYKPEKKENEEETEDDIPELAEGEEPKYFKQLIKANDSRALDYFSFDGEMIYYATYVESITKVGEEETEHTYQIQDYPISYKSLTSMCSMPYNFLFSLLQKSENPEYVMKVIDLLLKDSEVVLMIQDQLKVGVYEEEHYQAEKIVKETYKKETSVVNSGTGGSTEESNKEESTGGGTKKPLTQITKTSSIQSDVKVLRTSGIKTNTNTNKRVLQQNTNKKVLEQNTNKKVLEQNKNLVTIPTNPTTPDDTTEPTEPTPEIVETWELEKTDTTYGFPKGTVENKTVTTYENTANVFLKKAKTWCMDFEKTVEKEVVDNEAEEDYEYEEDDYKALTYPDTGTSDTSETGSTKIVTTTFLSNERLLNHTKMTSHNYIWNTNAENKQINYERFLGLWQNETGEYELDAPFKEDGKKVGYYMPEDNEIKSYPADVIPSEDGQNIDILLGLLNRHDNTQMHVQLMMYYWNKFTGENYYDVNIEDILSYVNTEVSTIIAGSASSNYVKAWEGGHLSADGKNYIVYEDGSAGHNNVAFGMATFITNPKRVIETHPLYGGGYYNHVDIFAKYGIDVRTLKEGDLVPVDIVEAAYADVLKVFQDKVDATLRANGIELTKNQIDALVNVCYKAGNINSFPAAYFKSLDSNRKCRSNINCTKL